MEHVIIYTDGACSGNPGPGGWAAIIKRGSAIREICGSSLKTTNNRMEMLAVINGLKALEQPCEVFVHSDSAYICNAINQRWLDKWKHNGWSASRGGSILNRDLWEEIDSLIQFHKVHFVKVKGHADDEYNNMCDGLARLAIEYA